MKVCIELTAKETSEAIENGVLLRLIQGEAAYEKLTIDASKESEHVNAKAPDLSTAAPNITPTSNTVPAEQPSQATAVPTSTKTYTMDELAIAGTTLMDQGRLAELQSLIQSFGVNTLTELPPAQFGAFALKLREMGAQI